MSGRYKQLLIKRGSDLVPVRLGKPLDKRLAGREVVVVVRIEKDTAYEVMTIQRMTGGARRFTFPEELVSEAVPDQAL
jgi:hypothetical protein